MTRVMPKVSGTTGYGKAKIFPGNCSTKRIAPFGPTCHQIPTISALKISGVGLSDFLAAIAVFTEYLMVDEIIEVDQADSSYWPD
jgi:hypothetical protein